MAVLFFQYEFLLRALIGSVAPQIIPALHLNVGTFALIGSAYYLTYGIMQIPVGILADKFQVKQLLLFAILICASSAFVFAHATDFTSAFIARLLMGFGSSFAFICLLITIMTWFPKTYLAFFVGFSQFIGSMGALLAGGPLVTLLVNHQNDWRMLLIKISMIGFTLAVLVFIIMKNKSRDNTQTIIYLIQPKPLKQRLLRLIKNPQAWFIAIYSGIVYISIILLGEMWGN